MKIWHILYSVTNGLFLHYPPIYHSLKTHYIPPVISCCCLGGRKGIRPVKIWVVGCWRGYLSGLRCTLLHMAQLMPLQLSVSCFSKIHIGFTFVVPAHLGSPGQRAVKRACVCAILTVLNSVACMFAMWFAVKTQYPDTIDCAHVSNLAMCKLWIFAGAFSITGVRITVTATAA